MNVPATQGTTAAQNQAMTAQNVQAINDQISAMIRATSQECKQVIQTGVVNNPVAGNNQINVNLRQVGLVKGFIAEFEVAFTNGGSAVASLTDWNIANLCSNISFFDLDNYQRINCAGWFMEMLATAKEGMPHATALLSTSFDTPIKYGSNFNVISASPTIAAGANGSATMRYWIPLAYSRTDLRGSVYMGVTNATSYLQFTINPAPGVATGDPTLAIYTGANSAVAITSVNYTIYQVYLDQLPRYSSGPNAGSAILPPIDTSTQYRLITTSLTGVSVSQDFPVPYSNFQQFLSLGIIYDQAGTLNAGTDINYFALAAANTYQLFKVSPQTQALFGRIKIKTDWPKGSYMFDYREQPISTNQTGNMQTFLNAISAAAGSQVLCGFESFALVNTVLGAASLPAS